MKHEPCSSPWAFAAVPSRRRAVALSGAIAVIAEVSVAICLLIVAGIGRRVRLPPAMPLMVIVLIAVTVTHRNVSEIHMHGGARRRRNGSRRSQQGHRANERDAFDSRCHHCLLGKKALTLPAPCFVQLFALS